MIIIILHTNTQAHLCRVHFSRILILNFMRISRQDTSSFHHLHSQSNQRGFQISLDATRQVVGMIRNPLTIVFDLTVDGNTQRSEMFRILHFSHPSRRCQERLARHTAAIDARATDIVAGKDGRVQVLRPGVQSGAVSAHAATDDGDIHVVLTALGSGQTGGSRRKSTSRRRRRD